MPFVSEEIFSILFKRYKKIASIHLEKWPTPYKEISKESAEKGELGIEVIKKLRTYKSQLQIPLNQEIKRIVIRTDKNQIEKIEDLREDIKNTIRIENFEVLEDFDEDLIKPGPDLKEKIEELNIVVYFFK